jgi:hypothetical protein
MGAVIVSELEGKAEDENADSVCGYVGNIDGSVYGFSFARTGRYSA